MDEGDFEFNIFEVANSENYQSLLDLCLDNLDFYNHSLNDDVDANGNTLLHLMAAKGDVFLVHKILKSGTVSSLVNAPNKNRETPLHLATRLGHFDTIKLLINFGARINLKDRKGECALFKAVKSGDPEILKFLMTKVKNGTDIAKTTNRDGDNLLHAAANNLPMMEFLMNEVGLLSNLDALNFSGNTPTVECVLTTTFHDNHHQPLAYLIREKGASIEASDYKSRTLLHLAVLRQDAKLVKFLLNRLDDAIKADSPDVNGCTPLHYAVELNSLDLVTLLVQNGANVNRPDSDSYTPLHLAAISDRITGAILEFLLAYGADISCRTFNGDSPLHLAASVGNEVGVQFLLPNCDVGFKRARNKDGLTPVLLAQLKGYKNVLDAMLSQ